MASAILGLAAATAFAQDAVLTGTDANDVITGTPAAESIYARGGDDVVNGGGGDDELDGGSGADVLNGGDGSDSVAYSGAAPVSVTLDGVANDGVAGELDNVGNDVEDIFTEDGADKITASAAANTIDTGAGDDRIIGGGGKDVIVAGDGDDVIEARDAAVDRIECGPGDDIATVDRNDLVSKDCERIVRPALSVEPGLTLVGRGSKLTMIISSLARGSTVVIACVKRCHPPAPQSKAIFTRVARNLGPGQTIRVPTPRRIAGATIEIGATARNASTNCVRFRITPNRRSYKKIRTRCTSIARSLPS